VFEVPSKWCFRGSKIEVYLAKIKLDGEAPGLFSAPDFVPFVTFAAL